MMIKSRLVACFALASVSLCLMGTSCPSKKPLTGFSHTGDPEEPAWVMMPQRAIDEFPGLFIFGTGISDKRISSPNIMRIQAEANARQDLARRLCEFAVSRMSQDTKDLSSTNGKSSSMTFSTDMKNRAAELIFNCPIVAHWVCRESGEYFALARLRYTDEMLFDLDDLNKGIIEERKAGNRAGKLGNRLHETNIDGQGGGSYPR